MTHATLQNFYGGGAEKKTRPAGTNPFSTAYGEFGGNTISQLHLQSLLKTADGLGKYSAALVNKKTFSLARTNKQKDLEVKKNRKSQLFQTQQDSF